MTNIGESPQDGHAEAPHLLPHSAALPDPVTPPQAVQQLRDAGFPDDEQAALTSAFLRVLALWTQQATREDVQTALHAGEERLTQQLETLGEALRREMAQHTEAVRAELQGTLAEQAAPARRWGAPLWLLTALLGLTCAGVLVLVVHSLLRW